MMTTSKKSDIANKLARAVPADEVFAKVNARPDVIAERAARGHRYMLADLMSSFRSIRNLTQTELAQRVGTSQPQIAKWESGEGNPTWDNVIAVFKALGVAAFFANGEIEMQLIERSRLDALRALVRAAGDDDAMVSVPRSELERLRRDSRELARLRDDLDEALLHPDSVDQSSRIFEVL